MAGTFPNLDAEMVRWSISQEDVASAAGVSRETVSNWLNGRTSIKQDHCMAIKKKFFNDRPEINTDYLFSRTPSYPM